MTVFLPDLRLAFSHGDPLAGLTQSPCFPLKSYSAVVLLGAVRVNISISIESVLFLDLQCFLGLLCSCSEQVGFLSDVCWTPDPSPRSTLNGKHKQNLSPSHFSPTQYGLVICQRSAPEKDKTKKQFIAVLELQSVGECVCLTAYATHKQTRHWDVQN